MPVCEKCNGSGKVDENDTVDSEVDELNRYCKLKFRRVVPPDLVTIDTTSELTGVPKRTLERKTYPLQPSRMINGRKYFSLVAIAKFRLSQK